MKKPTKLEQLKIARDNAIDDYKLADAYIDHARALLYLAEQNARKEWKKYNKAQDAYYKFGGYGNIRNKKCLR